MSFSILKELSTYKKSDIRIFFLCCSSYNSFTICDVILYVMYKDMVSFIQFKLILCRHVRYAISNAEKYY